MFGGYPPFPHDAPVIELASLSLTKLIAGDVTESRHLFEACQQTGFFLLDLRGSEQGQTLLSDAGVIFDMNKRIHDLDQEELAKHAFNPPGDLFG